jgi:glycosyltransferase involved in cell wall biosynthesis
MSGRFGNNGLAGRDIVCLSTHYWDERRFRKQEFMARFAESNRVLFVEPSFSILRRPNAEKRSVATNSWLSPTLTNRGDRLHVLQPPRGLPNWTEPHFERLSYRRYGRIIARAAERLAFKDIVLWVYNPSYAHGLDIIPHGHLVFDLVDDLAAYQGSNAARAAHVEGQVRDIIDRSDFVIVTAKTLLERYTPVARRIIHVPNGFDSQLFSTARPSKPAPASLGHIPRPILGFVGTIFTLLDFALLSDVARLHHDKSLVLVGPVEVTAARPLAQLAAQPNVFHVGPQPQATIPSFISEFDVCLNPFVTGPVADSVSPLKVYEYLAMGRPVVSVPMKSLQMEDAGRMVVFGDGAHEFSEQINLCLTDELQSAAPARTDLAAKYSWDRLFATVSSTCKEVLER